MTESIKNTAMNSGPDRRRWWILLIISFSILPIILSSSMVNIALPTIQRTFGATMSDLQWISNAYMLAFAGLMLFMGAMGDRMGRATVLFAGILVFGGANLGASFARTTVQLIAWRALMGAGSAMILPQTLAIITNVFPPHERGKAIGVWAGINSLGIALGPIIGGALVKNLEWTSIFYVNLPVAAIALIAGIFLLPNSRDPSRRSLDPVGTIASAIGVSALVYGLIQSSVRGWTDPLVLACLGGALLVLAFFAFLEKRSAHPMIDMGFFGKPRFAIGVAAVSIMSLALVGITFALTLFMQFVKSWDALATGVRLLPLATGILVGAGSADRAVRKFGRSKVIPFGFLGSGAAALAIAFSTLATPYWIFALALFFLGFFLGYIAAPATDAIMGALPKESAGSGSAINTVSRTVAGAVGVALLGSVLSTTYTAGFDAGAAPLKALPAEMLSAARESVGAAVILSEKIPAPLGRTMAELARESFMAGWKVVALISCGLCVLGAVLAVAFMPPRDDDRAVPAEEEGRQSAAIE